MTNLEKKTNTTEERLQRFVNFLDKKIDQELTRTKISNEDAWSACAVAQAYYRDMSAIINILEGREFNDNDLD